MKLQIELEFDDELKEELDAFNIVKILLANTKAEVIEIRKLKPFQMPADSEIKQFCYGDKKPEFTKHWGLVKQALAYFGGKNE